MTTTRPSSNTDWVGTQVEPSGGEKAAGFAAGDRPPAQWLNYLLGNTDVWVKFLNACFGDVLTQFGLAEGDSDSFARVLAMRQEAAALLNPLVSADLGSRQSCFASVGAISTRLLSAGTAGEIYTSDDLGRSWTARTAAGGYIGTFHTALQYSASLVVIAGDDGEIETSPDGITWTQRASGFATDQVRAMASRGTSIVVVGENGANARSTNGTSYTAGTDLVGAGYTLLDVAANVGGSSVFVCCGDGGGSTRANFVHRSTDGGVTWSPVNLTSILGATEYVEQVEWHAALGFVALVKDTGGSNVSGILLSADGLTWVMHGAAALTAFGLATQGYLVTSTGGIFIVSASTLFPTVYSGDGDTWAKLPIAVASAAGNEPKSLRILATESARLWVGAADASGKVYVSSPWIY